MLAVNNIPLCLVFYILPTISAVSAISGFGRLNYELVWLVVLPLLILLIRKHRLPSWSAKLLTIIAVFVSLKYIVPIFWTSKIVWRAWFLDFKWIYYLITAILWIGLIGKIKPTILYRYGRNFAIFYIIYVLCRIVINGHFSRDCSNLLDENNYDCFLLLIPFCFIETEKISKYDYFIFIIAVLLSTSKTGAFSLFSLLLYKYLRTSKHKAIILSALPIGVTLWAYIFFVSRGINDLESIDRAVFFLQFFEYIKNAPLPDILFGIFPGSSMDTTYIPAFEWYVDNFQNKNNITGCFPFYFHSTYMRLIIIWGIPLITFIICFLINKFNAVRQSALRNLLILFALESISLSSLSLVNVSIIFFIVIINTILNEKNHIEKRLTNY